MKKGIASGRVIEKLFSFTNSLKALKKIEDEGDHDIDYADPYKASAFTLGSADGVHKIVCEVHWYDL